MNRERWMQRIGLTADEQVAFVSVTEAASHVLDLPEQHPMERHEVCHAFHALQNYILARPALRSMEEEEAPGEP